MIRAVASVTTPILWLLVLFMFMSIAVTRNEQDVGNLAPDPTRDSVQALVLFALLALANYSTYLLTRGAP